MRFRVFQYPLPTAGELTPGADRRVARDTDLSEGNS